MGHQRTVSTIDDCKTIELVRHKAGRRGNLTVVEGGRDIPFDIKRVYYIYDVPGGEDRGYHAHKTLQQLVVAAAGSFSVVVDDGERQHTFFLNRPGMALYLPEGIWHVLADFSAGAVAMVLASDVYDEADYIRNYDEFITHKNNGR